MSKPCGELRMTPSWQRVNRASKSALGVGAGQALVFAQEFALENSVIVLRQLEQEALPVAALGDVLFELPRAVAPGAWREEVKGIRGPG